LSKRSVRFHNQRTTDALHPVAYRLIAACAALWVLATAMFLLGERSYMGLVFVLVAFFAIVTVAIPYALWRVRRNYLASRGREEAQYVSLQAWLKGRFETWQSRVEGRDAIVMILLPLATVSIGGLCFALIFHVLAR
jgi:hypothetical protein